MELKHLMQRLGEALLSLLVISLLIHGALAVAPGDAADTLAGDSGSSEQMAALRHELCLDEPFLIRYVDYVKRVILHGDWGNSLISGEPVAALLAERLWRTVALAVAAIVLAATVGIMLGVVTAFQSRPWREAAVIGITAIAMAAPSYWTGLLLMRLFAVQLKWLPVLSRGGVTGLVLPVLTMGMPLAAVILRLVRTHMKDELHAHYVRTAHAKGVTKRRVFTHHVLRNSLPPIIIMLALHLGHLLGGAFVVETLFSWPGLGRLMVQAIRDRDMPLVMGAGLLTAGLYIFCNLVADLVHDGLDPRARKSVLAGEAG